MLFRGPGPDEPTTIDVEVAPLSDARDAQDGLDDRDGEPERWSTADLESMVVTRMGHVPSTEFGVVVQDSQSAIIACTPIAEQILGLDFDQMRGRTSRDPRWATITTEGRPLHGDRHPPVAAMQDGRPQRNVVVGVQRGSDPAGEHVWIRVTSFPIDIDDPPRLVGSLAGGVISALTRLDAAREAELRLAQSERMFRMMTERSLEVVGIHDLTGVWLWASPAAVAVLGYEPRDLFGHDVFDIIHPDDVEVATAALERLLADRLPAVETLRVIRRDGAHIWVEVAGQIITDDEGRPHQLQSSFRDVTRRVRAESAQALAEQARASAEQARRNAERAQHTAERARDAAVAVFGTVMAESPLGMVLRGPHAQAQSVNAAVCRLLGVDDHEILGTTLVDRAVPDDRGIVADALAAMIDGDVTNASYEARFTVADETRWIASSAMMLPGQDGAPPAVLESLQDVTDRKLVELDLQRRASTDPLTGLPHRARFLELLEAALADGRAGGPPVSVLFIDVDGFKAVNDSHGHAAGDALLRQLASRLDSAIGPHGTVSRYGGDEFAAVVRDEGDALAARFESLNVELACPFDVEGTRTTLTVSIGTATDAGETPENLIRAADRAMYFAKHRAAHTN